MKHVQDISFSLGFNHIMILISVLANPNPQHVVLNHVHWFLSTLETDLCKKERTKESERDGSSCCRNRSVTSNVQQKKKRSPQ